MDERRRLMMRQGGGDTGPIDLSMVDNAGNPRASMTTANCYLVHSAGKYMIPLVYGNAIKNGTANTVAYAPGGTASTTYCANFINHNGDAITAPWITKSGSGVDAGMGISVTSAELLWQDVQSLITSVSVNGNYLYFTVGTFNGGNALIAVKSGSTIVWSWHIWATTETLTTTTSIATGSRTYNVAPVNLGWVPTSSNGKKGYCPFYQWGRKDPFIPSTGSADTNHTVYNISNSSVTRFTYQSSTTATIADNIKNPTYNYYNSSTKGPVTTTYYNMWDAQNKSTSNVTTATKKTIYDPCPPGFCVPTGNLYYYMGNGGSRNDTSWDTDNKGKTWTLNTPNLYFPATGNRSSSGNGNIINFGINIICHSASPSSGTDARSIYTYYSKTLKYMNWTWNSSNRWYSYTVRPVLE